MLALLSKVTSKSDLKLPPIDGASSQAVKPETAPDDKTEIIDDKAEDENAFLKPYDFDFWVKAADANKTIYYYNTKTGESQWLAPCSVCFKTGDKWCLDCACSFCDKHYAKKHRNTKSPEHESLRKHKWSKVEMVADQQEPLVEPGDVHCIECQLKVATKLCDVCWDAYCTRCFDLVHHVGQLKTHNGMNYRRAKLQWHVVHQPSAAAADSTGPSSTVDVFVNGATGERTFEKPHALMTPLERILQENFETHRAAAEEAVQKIEALQLELERARYERDTLRVENGQLLQQIKSGKGGPAGGIAVGNSAKMQSSEYRQMILQSSDRRRGEARNNQIQQLIQQPLPTASTK